MTVSRPLRDAGRPLWAGMGEETENEGTLVVIVAEAFHPLFKSAQELMEMIAEPKSRTDRMHLYKLTENSLYTAVSLGMSGAEVVRRLQELCRSTLSADIIRYITDRTDRAGKVKLILASKRVLTDVDVTTRMYKGTYVSVHSWSTRSVTTNFLEVCKEVERDILSDPKVKQYCLQDSCEEHEAFVRFEIRPDTELIELKRYFKEQLRYPLDCVYAYTSDTFTDNVNLRMKTTARLRPYQSLTLSKTLGTGRARSGLIVLPCGAGKTLVGVSTATLIGKTTIVVCLNALTVMQWWQQFRLWTNADTKQVSVFTAGKKDIPSDIVITTYNMLGFPDNRRAEGSPELIAKLREKEWGTMILDEVHVAPAQTFRRILNRVNAHCIIGLTATLVREDDKITDLHYLVGPKLYEANWRELQRAGYLADITCIEVLCPMEGPFLAAYLSDPIHRSSNSLIPIMNPAKVQATAALVQFHRERGDKILLFSDRPAVVDFFAKQLHIPQIVGEVTENERYSIVNHFKGDSTLYALALSAAAETGTDIPDANVIIQISCTFGSQRQEAQRLGRILRPKKGGQGNCGWYYSLVSRDTREPADHAQRRRFLQEQGYAFNTVPVEEVLDVYKERNPEATLPFSTRKEQLDLLDHVVNAKYAHLDAAGPAAKRPRKN